MFHCFALFVDSFPIFNQVDPDLYNSMRWILDNDISGVLDHTFCVDHNSFGERVTHELKPNGENIKVTEANKKEYVKLYVNWRFLRGIEAQFLSLSKVSQFLRLSTSQHRN